MTPMESVLSKLNSVGIDLSKLNVLEMFGCVGKGHIDDYVDKVGSLDIWEIDSQCEPILKVKFPQANIKICDSFQEVQATPNKYDMVILDNPMAVYGDGKYCENFELFPDIFRITNDSCILILNVIPSVTEEWKKSYPHVFTPEHLQRRCKFYQCEQSTNLGLDYLAYTYAVWIFNAGYYVKHMLAVERSCVYYLGLVIERR